MCGYFLFLYFTLDNKEMSVYLIYVLIRQMPNEVLDRDDFGHILSKSHYRLVLLL